MRLRTKTKLKFQKIRNHIILGILTFFLVVILTLYTYYYTNLLMYLDFLYGALSGLGFYYTFSPHKYKYYAIVIGLLIYLYLVQRYAGINILEVLK